MGEVRKVAGGSGGRVARSNHEFRIRDPGCIDRGPRQDADMPRPWRVVVLVAALAALVVGGIFIALDVPTTDRLRFDKAAWATGKGREGMVEDLHRNHLPMDLSRDEVLRLIGPATRTDASTMHYDVGAKRLDIVFDDAGRIRATALHMD